MQLNFSITLIQQGSLFFHLVLGYQIVTFEISLSKYRSYPYFFELHLWIMTQYLLDFSVELSILGWYALGRDSNQFSDGAILVTLRLICGFTNSSGRNHGWNRLSGLCCLLVSWVNLSRFEPRQQFSTLMLKFLSLSRHLFI